MMKKISFDYLGGEYTQKLKISGENLPWRYECAADWLTITTGATSLTIKTTPTYDFEEKTTEINIFDKYNNKLTLNVNQTGYTNLSLECTTNIVLYKSYFDQFKTFDLYITVYGGKNQEISSDKLNNKISKVWDNSDLYNDFMLHIDKDMQGTYTLEHQELNRYKIFCEKNNLPFNIDKLKKDITVTQISNDDLVGTCIIEVDGKQYTSKDKCELYINSTTPVIIKILSNKYVHVISNTKYEEINHRKVDIEKMAQWVKYTLPEPHTISILADDYNWLSERRSNIRLVNHSNSHQYMDITLIQTTNS